MKHLYMVTLLSIVARSCVHAADRYLEPFTSCELLENTIKNGTLEEALQLLDQHNIDITNDQATYLHLACWWGKSDMAHELLKRGAHLNATDMHGRTPLFYAITKSRALAQELLLKEEIVVNIQDNDKKTPLHDAASIGHADIVTTLLKLNAKPDIQDCYGQTPADLARINGCNGTAELIDNWQDLLEIKEPDVN